MLDCANVEWLEDGPVPDEATYSGYRLQAANLNIFGKIVEEQGFYDNCAKMPHTGDQPITVTLD